MNADERRSKTERKGAKEQRREEERGKGILKQIQFLCLFAPLRLCVQSSKSFRRFHHPDRQQQVRVDALIPGRDGQAHLWCAGGVVELEPLDLLQLKVRLRVVQDLAELVPDRR